MESQNRFLTPSVRSHLQEKLELDLRPEYRRRIEIMLLADQGRSQTQICDQLGCSHETARYWMTMAQAGNALDWSDRPMGRPKTVNDDYRKRLKELVTRSPREFGYAFRRWTARWLAKHLEQELSVTISHRYINYLLKQMGLSTRDPIQESAPNRHHPPTPSAASNRTDAGNRMATLLKTG